MTSALLDAKGRPIQKAVVPQTPAVIQQGLTASGMDSITAYGPGRPLNPITGYSQRGRQMDYPLSVNIAIQSRTLWGRTPYPILRAMIDAYDVARMCINHKIDELRSMELMFVPLDGQAGSKRGPDIDMAIEVARDVLEFPDGQLPYQEWLGQLMESALRYDAAPLYHRRNLDGDVIALEVMDGSTVMPYIDEFGRRPKPPSPAYYQIIHGQVFDWFTSDDITFNRFRPQPDSPFGLAPIESILLTANTDLRFQQHFLQMFTDGSIPGGFVEVPADVTSPAQVQEWQEYWDALVMGDQAKLHQLVAVANGTKITTFAPKDFDDKFPEYLMGRTCAAFGVTPQDIGLIDDVNRANGETQVDIQFRVNTLPWVIWLQGILTRYVRYDLGLPVQVKLDTGRDKEDRLAEAQAWKIYTDAGYASIDEARQELLGLPIDNDRPMPRIFVDPKAGPIPLANILSIAGPTNPETGAPVDEVPLQTTPYDGAEGILASKSPGGAQFKRAPVNPDEPMFPDLEHVVPGSDVIGTKPAAPVIGDPGAPAPDAETDVPLAKEATAGVTSATGITGHDLIGDEPDEPESDDEAVQKEQAAFARFAKARRRDGKWRDFQFAAVALVEAHRLNDQGRAAIRKDAGQLIAAGLCVLAADTGRVLMLQRALDPEDPAAGMWEFPGGHIEDGEQPLAAAIREWTEETGCALPVGAHTGTWSAGVYQGFVWTIPAEATLPIFADRDACTNPDDPDGDCVEAVAWWAPGSLSGNPVIRAELAAAMDSVQAAISPAPVVKAQVPDDVPKGPAGNPRWHKPVRDAEAKTIDYHAAKIRGALSGTITKDQLKTLVSAYMAKQ